MVNRAPGWQSISIYKKKHWSPDADNQSNYSHERKNLSVIKDFLTRIYPLAGSYTNTQVFTQIDIKFKKNVNSVKQEVQTFSNFDLKKLDGTDQKIGEKSGNIHLTTK